MADHSGDSMEWTSNSLPDLSTQDINLEPHFSSLEEDTAHEQGTAQEANTYHTHRNVTTQDLGPIVDPNPWGLGSFEIRHVSINDPFPYGPGQRYLSSNLPPLPGNRGHPSYRGRRYPRPSKSTTGPQAIPTTARGQGAIRRPGSRYITRSRRVDSTRRGFNIDLPSTAQSLASGSGPVSSLFRSGTAAVSNTRGLGSAPPLRLLQTSKPTLSNTNGSSGTVVPSRLLQTGGPVVPNTDQSLESAPLSQSNLVVSRPDQNIRSITSSHPLQSDTALISNIHQGISGASHSQITSTALKTNQGLGIAPLSSSLQPSTSVSNFKRFESAQTSRFSHPSSLKRRSYRDTPYPADRYSSRPFRNIHIDPSLRTDHVSPPTLFTTLGPTPSNPQLGLLPIPERSLMKEFFQSRIKERAEEPTPSEPARPRIAKPGLLSNIDFTQLQPSSVHRSKKRVFEPMSRSERREAQIELFGPVRSRRQGGLDRPILDTATNSIFGADIASESTVHDTVTPTTFLTAPSTVLDTATSTARPTVVSTTSPTPSLPTASATTPITRKRSADEYLDDEDHYTPQLPGIFPDYDSLINMSGSTRAIEDSFPEQERYLSSNHFGGGAILRDPSRRRRLSTSPSRSPPGAFPTEESPRNPMAGGESLVGMARMPAGVFNVALYHSHRMRSAVARSAGRVNRSGQSLAESARPLLVQTYRGAQQLAGGAQRRLVQFAIKLYKEVPLWVRKLHTRQGAAQAAATTSADIPNAQAVDVVADADAVSVAGDQEALVADLPVIGQPDRKVERRRLQDKRAGEARRSIMRKTQGMSSLFLTHREQS